VVGFFKQDLRGTWVILGGKTGDERGDEARVEHEGLTSFVSTDIVVVSSEVDDSGWELSDDNKKE